MAIVCVILPVAGSQKYIKNLVVLLTSQVCARIC